MSSPGNGGQAPWLEWVFGAAGALFFGAIMIVLVSNAGTADSPPSVRVEVEAIEPAGPAFAVTFVAVNEGDATAAAVQLEAILEGADGLMERRQVVIDFLPPHSERRGGFLFVNDPRNGRITINAHGYVDP